MQEERSRDPSGTLGGVVVSLLYRVVMALQSLCVALSFAWIYFSVPQSDVRCALGLAPGTSLICCIAEVRDRLDKDTRTLPT